MMTKLLRQLIRNKKMQVTYKCERCGIDKTIEVKVPKTCSKECRLFLFAEKRKAFQETRKAEKLQINQQTMNTENNPNESVGNENTQPLEETPQPTLENGEPIPTPETPAPDSGSEGNPSDIGRSTPGEDRVEAPSQPAEDTRPAEGQA